MKKILVMFTMMMVAMVTFAKDIKTNRNIRYQIEDNFLRIWFRYIYKYGYMIEVGANKKLKMVMDKSYTTYTGKVLERYFLAKMIESEEYTQIASWWDRKGENEIDIIAADELEQKAWENMCRVDAKKKAIEKQLKTEKNPARIVKLKDQIMTLIILK